MSLNCKTPDDVLEPGYKKGREDEKPYKAKTPEIGDKCRVLIKLRKNMRPMLSIGDEKRLYKSYHARHFTKQIHKIKAVTKTKAPLYYVNGKWHDRDALLLVSGVDSKTADQIAARAAH